jgi:acyl-CoA thioesterase-2
VSRLPLLIERLSLQEQSPHVFVGGSGDGGVGAESRLFGGLVASQAAMAAMLTVDDFPMHSLHAYFLRPGRPNVEIAYHVHASKDGRNFASRHIEAWQSGDCIFQMMASFHRLEQGVEHAPTMPEAPEPLSLKNRDELRGRSNWQNQPIDVRMATEITNDSPQEPHQKVWLKANGDLPDDPRLHLALTVYASDRTLLDTAWRPHTHHGQPAGASLDHAMWFHQPPVFDDWLLYDMQSPVAHGSRGLALGHMFNTAGQCLISVAQEGLVKFR